MGELKPLVEPVVKTDIVLYEGVTTLAGNVGGTTLIDAALIGSNDFLTDVTMYITSGAASLETRDITGFNPANGTITVGTAFSAQIVADVTFKVLAFKPATAEVAAIAADIGNASASALGSLYDILGNPSASLATTILDGLDARTNNPTLNDILNFPDTAGYTLYDSLIGNVNEINRVAGKTQILEVHVTNAANVGNVTLATATTQPCILYNTIIHANAAQTTNLTSCGIFAGAGNVINVIDPVLAIQSALDAVDKEVSKSIQAGVYLPVGKTIVIDLVGTGATAVDLTVTFLYKAVANGGYLV